MRIEKINLEKKSIWYNNYDNYYYIIIIDIYIDVIIIIIFSSLWIEMILYSTLN